MLEEHVKNTKKAIFIGVRFKKKVLKGLKFHFTKTKALNVVLNHSKWDLIFSFLSMR